MKEGATQIQQFFFNLFPTLPWNLHLQLPIFYSISITAMATVVKLHVFPESFNNQQQHRLRRKGFGCSTSLGVFGFGHNNNCDIGLFSVKKCRAFKTEEGGGGDLKEKKFRTLKRNEVKELKRESGFWSSLRSILLRNFMVGSKSDDEYRHAVVRVEEVLSSVSSSFCCFIILLLV